MKKISLFHAVNTPEMESAAIEVMRSGAIANGPYVTKFEEGFGNLIHNKNVVTTIDMNSALFLALHLSGIGEGDEVLTTAFACLSTNSAIAQKKAIPVWVDLKPNSVEIDLEDLKSKINHKTKAVILYHIAGYPGPAKEVAKLCNKHNIVMIEDCNNALFASRDGDPVGTFGDYSIYSFYPNRQINATEGGALVCRDPASAERARKLRRFGIDAATFRTKDGEINPCSDVKEIGWSVTLNNFCSAIAYAQLNTVQDRFNQTKANAEKLLLMLESLHESVFVPKKINDIPSYWAFLIFVKNRDEALSGLKQVGIMASCIHSRNDVYSGFHLNQSLKLHNTDYLQNHILAIPCGWWLGDEDLINIRNTLAKVVT